jgi:hypothetical protein
MIFSSIFGVICGIGIIGHWTISFFNGRIPELETEPIRIRFHIAAEAVTALMLIIAGVGLWAAAAWGSTLYLLAVGMLFYTVIISPGYFAQQGKWKWVAIFGLLLILAIFSLFLAT